MRVIRGLITGSVLLALTGSLLVGPPAAQAIPAPIGEGLVTWIDEAVWAGHIGGCCQYDGDPAMAPDYAVWAPDGRHVAVLGDVLAANDGTHFLVLDGVTQKVVDFGAIGVQAARPAWDPTSTMVALVKDNDIVIYSASDGQQIQQVTFTGAVAKSELAWSPDGSRIAYQAADGVHTVLAQSGGDKLLVAGAGKPRYSLRRGLLGYTRAGTVRYANTDGTNERDTGVGANDWDWSPTGESLVLFLSDWTIEQWGAYETWVIGLDGKGLRGVPTGGPGGSYSWQPIPAPVATLTKPAAAFGATSTIPVTFSTTRSAMHPPLADVRMRRTPALGGTSTSWVTARSDLSTSSTSLAARPGWRTCIQARTRTTDPIVVGPWSAVRCVTTPFDDRQLTAGAGWTRGIVRGWLDGTGTTTYRQGARLTTPYGSVRRIGVLAHTCSTCGKVAVFVGSVRVGTVSLASSTPGRRLIVLPDRGTALRGSVRIVVVSSGKRVSVDGVLATAVAP